MSKSPKDLKPATRLVTSGRRKEWTSAPGSTSAVVNPPVWRASTHLYANMAALRGEPNYNADGRFYYGRRGAPTQWALAEALTEMEPGAAGTVLYPSGVAAIAGVLLTALRPGDVLWMTDNAYEPSRTFGLDFLKPFGIETRFFDPLDVEGFAAGLCERSRAVLLESPGSLTVEVQDVPALAAVARRQGMISVIDNTWATALGFQPLRHGVDISIMSLTKHVGGHSDLMMGSASAGEEWYQKLRRASQVMGNVVSPDDAALALRGLRTLGVRLERQTASAITVARWLQTRPEVACVLCPMLPGAPGHELWSRDFTGGCGLFSIVFKSGDAVARARFIDALTLFGIGYSWGGFESLVVPVDPGGIRTATPWPLPGLAPENRLGLRLAIGLEDPDDLIRDLAQAFGVWD